MSPQLCRRPRHLAPKNVVGHWYSKAIISRWGDLNFVIDSVTVVKQTNITYSGANSSCSKDKSTAKPIWSNLNHSICRTKLTASISSKGSLPVRSRLQLHLKMLDKQVSMKQCPTHSNTFGRCGVLGSNSAARQVQCSALHDLTVPRYLPNVLCFANCIGVTPPACWCKCTKSRWRVQNRLRFIVKALHWPGSYLNSMVDFRCLFCWVVILIRSYEEKYDILKCSKALNPWMHQNKHTFSAALYQRWRKLAAASKVRCLPVKPNSDCLMI